MDTKINLPQVYVPFFLDENCILMCVHKDEREKSSYLLVCLFFPPSIPDATSGDFIQEYFWMAAIDVYDSLRIFALLEIRVPPNCILISLSFASTRGASLLAALAHTWLMYAENIVSRCLTTFRRVQSSTRSPREKTKRHSRYFNNKKESEGKEFRF